MEGSTGESWQDGVFDILLTILLWQDCASTLEETWYYLELSEGKEKAENYLGFFFCLISYYSMYTDISQ